MSRIVTHVANFADKSAQVAIQGVGGSAEAAISEAVKNTGCCADQFVAEECTERMGAYLETKSLSRWRTVKVDGRSLVDLYDEDAEWSFIVHVNMRAHVPVKIAANSLAEAHAEIEKLLAGENGTEVLVDIAVDQCLADDGVVLDSIESLDLANHPEISVECETDGSMFSVAEEPARKALEDCTTAEILEYLQEREDVVVTAFTKEDVDLQARNAEVELSPEQRESVWVHFRGSRFEDRAIVDTNDYIADLVREVTALADAG